MSKSGGGLRYMHFNLKVCLKLISATEQDRGHLMVFLFDRHCFVQTTEAAFTLKYLQKVSYFFTS